MTKPTHIADEFWRRLAQNPILMVGLPGEEAHAEPMTAALDLDAHPTTVFFFAGPDNRLVRGMASSQSVARAEFVAPGYDFFASLRGRISLVQDASLIRRLWSNEASVWTQGHQDDPQVRMIRLDVDHIEIWKLDQSLPKRLRRLFGGTLDAEQVRRDHVTTHL